MHSYLRAIGFSKKMRKSAEEKFIQEIIASPTRVEVAQDSKGDEFVELTKEITDSMGIKVCGEYDENGTFQMDYYYPYLEGYSSTTFEHVDIEKHSERESYAGVCDEMKLGITLIFHLQNVAEYLKKRTEKISPFSTALSGLSLEGKIILPIYKSEKQLLNIYKSKEDRSHLIAAAREGDEDAIENLTLEDMDTYSMLTRRIVNEDILSIVDSTFMPYGIESDQYSILAEIVDYELVENPMTGDEVYLLYINCNDLVYGICINKKDLLGEPEVGRRFKGVIWMQGQIRY